MQTKGGILTGNTRWGKDASLPIADFQLPIWADVWSHHFESQGGTHRPIGNRKSEIGNCSHGALHSFHVEDAGNAFDGVDDFVEVLDVKDFDSHLNVSLFVGGH
jgi:hypothetical protein